EKYNFDWPLLMAMAYQESGLNPKRKSYRGAVGIMQIRPSTAKEVGIRDISKVENNIHAAVKYLDYLRKRYFNDPKLRPRDRVRFSLAAYNAGPAKVRKARNLARRMGLNPARWFRNVEIAMLRLVGQETVRYVSNINKYYILYKLAIESGELYL
ncbi:MAG: lytic transglycosylase F, partial [Nitrospirae bacterium]